MPDYDTVRVEREEAVAIVTMNRPERRNALSPQLDADLRAALDGLAADDAVRAIVLQGAGDGFCAGADLTVLRDDPTPDELYAHLTERYLPLVKRLVTFPAPVLAAVNGTAAGAGMALALAGDLRVMADDAQLMMAFSSIGFVPDSGASYLLVRQVGYSRAFELAAEAAPLPADRCRALGLANRVVPPGDLRSATRSWAQTLAQRPTRALAATKQALQYAETHTLDETVRYEAALQRDMVQTDDHAEGLAAFLEKRAPDFSGS